MKTIATMLRISRRLALMLPVLVLAVALVVHAQSTQSGYLNNPLASNISTIPGFLQTFFTALVKISLPIITVFIVYSGFLFVTAQGNKIKLEIARRNFLFVIIGALLILAAWILAQIIAGTLLQVVGSN